MGITGTGGVVSQMASFFFPRARSHTYSTCAGLLPLLQSVTTDVHLSELAGQVVAVDAFCWLHRSTYMCATELALGKPTDKYAEKGS